MGRVIIVDSVRTGITKSFRGKLRNVRPDNLAAKCVDELFRRNESIDAIDVEDCIVGCAFPEGAQGMNLGRNIAVLSQLSTNVAGSTVNRYCGSGLQAVAFAAGQIKDGGAEAIVAGGVESISMTLKHINTRHVYNAQIKSKAPGMYLAMNTEDDQPDFMKNTFFSMGMTAEVVAERYGIKREEQDYFAYSSQVRTYSAQRDGIFDEEIVPITITLPKRPGSADFREEILNRDECNRPESTLESLAALSPSFKDGGTVTAGNSSQITDGACMCLLASEDYVMRRGLPRLGYFHGYATSGCQPEEMGVGPVKAIKKLLSRFHLSMNDIDLFELNEAFASTIVYCQKVMNIDLGKLNVNGGAISVGHPFGMTGARQIGHILRELRRRDKRFGVVAMCIGGGMGLAALVERV